MAAPLNVTDDLLQLLFLAAASTLPCSRTGAPTSLTRRTLRRTLPPSHSDDYLDFLGFAALSTNLLLPTNGTLTLAPAAHAWAASSHRIRLAAIRDAIFTHPLAFERWRSHHRPGWRLLKFLPTTEDAFASLVPPTTRNSSRDIARRIGRIASDLLISDSIASSPRALADALANAHTWLAPCRARPAPSLTLHLHFEESHNRPVHSITTISAPPTLDFLELASITDLVAPHTLALSRSSVERALTLGINAAAVLHRLDQHLPHLTRPLAFDAAVRRWARTCGAVRLHHVVLLETRSAELLDELLHTRRARSCISRTLSPRTAVVDPRHLSALRKRLHRIPGFVDLSESPAASLTANVHLYIAAHIAHLLPDLVPLPFRTPYSLVTQLARALSPAERALADQSIAAWRSSVADHPLPTSWLQLDPPQIDSLEAAQRARLDACTHAATHRLSLTFTYQGRDDVQPAPRRVEALRIEWRRTQPFLVAFDLDIEEERTFRLDRIMNAPQISQSAATRFRLTQ